MNIGMLIKEKRLAKKMTLRDLGQKSNLSIGFLSQLERGMSSIALDSLQNICVALDVDMNYFLTVPQKHNSNIVIHSYEHAVSFLETDKFIHHYLSNDLQKFNFFPELIDLLPGMEKSLPYTHAGDEFIYVLEGILHLDYMGVAYELYPGDCATFKANKSHNWHNFTNRMVKILVVHYPNPFFENK